MSTITLRATKGSPLTNTEVDSNFSNLNTDKLESTYAGAMNSLTGGSSITTVSSTTGITTGAWKASVIGAAYGGTGVANGATSTITLGGALTFTGSYTFGATLTANTSVTFPTSGTLATTTGTMASGATWNGNVIAPAYGGTGIANGTNNTITFNGNYTLGLSLTGNTSVTLPTTGTLATIAGSEALTNKTINGLTVSTTTGTLTVANSKTLTASNTLTFTGTDSSSVAFGSGGTVAYTNVATLSSLTSVGTIATGVWNATAIGPTYGGTGLSSYTAGDMIYASATNVLNKLAKGSDGQVLTLASGVPTWSASTGASTGKAIAMAMVFGA